MFVAVAVVVVIVVVVVVIIDGGIKDDTGSGNDWQDNGKMVKTT